MSHCFQFVDVIGATPDVLLDLDDADPFWVADGASISPPSVRRSATQGLGDGSIETGSSYDDRTIVLPLRLARVDSETQAQAIQKLIRILDRRDGAWLRMMLPGMAEPLFFRTRRASAEVIDEIADAKPDRTIKVELLADPAASGLPETGHFDITNDPTADEDPMMHTFGEILGDVMTPLHLTFPLVDGDVPGTGGDFRVVWASQAAFDGTAQVAPYYKSLSEATKLASPPAAWTINDVADSSMVSGTARRVTHTSTTDPDFLVPTQQALLEWDVPHGDYRVMVRLAGVDAGMKLYFWNKIPAQFNVLTLAEAAGYAEVFATDAGHDWYDLGVVALPGGAPLSDSVYGLDGDLPGPALWNFGHYAAASGATVDYDCVVLVPAGRPNTLTRHGSAQFSFWYLNRTATLDGVSNRRFATGRWYGTYPDSMSAPTSVTGALPVVVPGAINTLTLFATASLATADVDDDKTTVTPVDYLYFPRYLYQRPALT